MRPSALRLLVPALLVVLTLGLSACDSTSSVDGTQLDGNYRVTSFTFDSENTTYGVINVLPYLATSPSLGPELGIDLFARNRAFTFSYRLASDNLRTSIQGTYSVRGSTVTLALDDEAAATRILVPSRLPLTLSEITDELVVDTRQTVSLATLAQLDPNRYRGLSGALTGRLQIRLTRVR